MGRGEGVGGTIFLGPQVRRDLYIYKYIYLSSEEDPNPVTIIINRYHKYLFDVILKKWRDCGPSLHGVKFKNEQLRPALGGL